VPARERASEVRKALERRCTRKAGNGGKYANAFKGEARINYRKERRRRGTCLTFSAMIAAESNLVMKSSGLMRSLTEG
jgi:hypothetical protein